MPRSSGMMRVRSDLILDEGCCCYNSLIGNGLQVRHKQKLGVRHVRIRLIRLRTVLDLAYRIEWLYEVLRLPVKD